jgi:hypothetical protein
MNEGGEFVDIGLLLVCNLTAERKWLSSPSNNAAQKSSIERRHRQSAIDISHVVCCCLFPFATHELILYQGALSVPRC